ncbi:NAD(P)-binding protein [Coniochaeta ligniaria NRRL 30616]|uniref:NAD(P)-binding protein n=1 Tax=Coniochaeta ligniaria NRRL 30616 TaxID=1408157 RepID=A0A1J7J7E7_9PEZI|nr:NAD(P)-binding protein [Coniochaeta ligniaria NRRL 30616]
MSLVQLMMQSQRASSRGKVLLTGGSGFIASHILDQLVDQGFNVVVTVRSEEKGQRIVDTYQGAAKENVSYVVVEDITKEGAFDAAVKSQPPFDYVIHTASPYHLNPQDPVKDFLDPAIKGTTGILHSINAHAPTVNRVVFTSSSAAILNPKQHADVYDETHWAPMTWDEALQPTNAYRASKIYAEQAAWKFVEVEQPGFDLATINNTYTFGPLQRHLSRLEAMNASNHRIRDLVQGKMKEALQPTAPVFTFVDVRDVAFAHVRALTVPEAGGSRFYVVGGHFSNKKIADVIRDAFPQLADRLPPRDAPDDFPEKVYRFDNAKSREVLGLEYTSFEKSVRDTVQSILDSGLLGSEVRN